MIKKVTLNKTKCFLVENELNELSKVRLISTKGLTRDLINVCRILKGAKYFFEDGSQNHFLF